MYPNRNMYTCNIVFSLSALSNFSSVTQLAMFCVNVHNKSVSDQTLHLCKVRPTIKYSSMSSLRLYIYFMSSCVTFADILIVSRIACKD